MIESGPYIGGDRWGQPAREHSTAATGRRGQRNNPEDTAPCAEAQRRPCQLARCWTVQRPPETNSRSSGLVSPPLIRGTWPRGHVPVGRLPAEYHYLEGQSPWRTTRSFVIRSKVARRGQMPSFPTFFRLKWEGKWWNSLPIRAIWRRLLCFEQKSHGSL